MIEAKLTKEYLDLFVDNLRSEDKEELVQFYPTSLEEFSKTCFEDNQKIYFVLSDKIKPLALGGAYLIKNKKYKTAQVWLLSSNEIKESKIELFKYVLARLEEFKNEYEILFNYIYKTNFSALKWLKKAGFKVVDLKNADYKLFYYFKGDLDFDLRYFAC